VGSDALARAIEEIADGNPIDWPALREGVGTEALALVKGLEIIGGVAQLHRLAGTPDAPSDGPPGTNPGILCTTTAVVPMEHAQSWGRYRLLESVGQGSFGTVYRAWDPELEREIAIKILHPQSANEELRDRLLSEGRLLVKVRHPNVVNVFGVESHGDRVGLCMEFVHGETLESVLARQGTLSAREAVPIAEDVCSALSAVHRARFLHRDVKTKNVMRAQDGGRIVLMDFGAGLSTDDAAQAGWFDVVGTPLYMAPEVMRGEPATPASDVYSVGVLIYHLVTGEYPVGGRPGDDLIADHRDGRQRLLSDRRPDLPVRFTQVVTRALSPDLRQRFATPGALRDALREIANETSRLDTYLRPVGVAAAVAVFLTALGALSTLTFNVSLGRSGFVGETAWDALYWGARSCVGPALLIVMSFAALSLLSVIRRLTVAASATVRRFDASVRHQFDAVTRRLHLDDTTVLASYALLICAVAVIVACWWFQPLLLAFTMNATTAPAEALRLLAPGAGGVPNNVHVNYRLTFTWIAILSSVGWYLLWRRSVRRHQPMQTSVLAAGIGVIVFALALVDYPYRLFYHNQFDVATFRGETCYVVGERGDDVLLFCPMTAPPRDRRTKSSDPEFKRTDLRGSVFGPFAANR
jgi:hypothetical protein